MSPLILHSHVDGAYYEQNTGFSGHSNNSYYATQGQHSGMGNSYGNLNGHVYHGGGVHEPSLIGGTKIVFSYEELMEITSGFSRQNIIGEGGFGCVYKGQLPNGRFVAVKQLKIGSGQGDREFRAEVEIISRVHHRHLVSLVGYCISEQQRLLIYEFVPNRTLDHHLHGKLKYNLFFLPEGKFHWLLQIFLVSIAFTFWEKKRTTDNASNCSFLVTVENIIVSSTSSF